MTRMNYNRPKKQYSDVSEYIEKRASDKQVKLILDLGGSNLVTPYLTSKAASVIISTLLRKRR